MSGYLQSWATYIVAAFSIVIGFVSARIADMRRSVREDAMITHEVETLKRKVDEVDVKVNDLDGKFEAMARDHADLRVAVAELPKRVEQQAQFETLRQQISQAMAHKD
jgi:chromosome segregation ATPase